MADPVVIPQVAVLAGGGIVAGVGLLVRGFIGYGTAARIADTSTSRISALAVGEVRVSGAVEPAELALVSPLQSAPCVYYRASVQDSGGDGARTAFAEERAVGFRVRDPSGSVRVFPRAAVFDVPARFDEATGAFGGSPPGLRLRAGPGLTPADPSRDQLVAELLTVRSPDGTSVGDTGAGGRRYTEARLEAGDVVTVVGQAMPFDQLPDPAAADLGDGPADPGVVFGDSEIAADLAAARASGILAATAEEAWGNAAIPGFGRGRPVHEPDLHPDAHDPPIATEVEAIRAERTFSIAPDALILSAAPGAPLLIAAGPPEGAAERHEQRFLVGLLGAVLAIASAVVLGVMLSGGFGT